MTGEDLGLTPSTLKQARFGSSPLSKFLNKGLKEAEKEEGPLKILKNFEHKSKKQLKAIEDQGNKQLNAIKNINTGLKSSKMIDFFSGLSPEAKQLLNEIQEEQNDINLQKLVCTKSDRKIFNFNTFKPSSKLVSNIFNGKITLEETKKDQYEMFKQLKYLEKYDPNNLEKINSRKETLVNTEELYDNRDYVNEAFENRVFPFTDGFQKKKSDMSHKLLPNWVKVEKKRFDRIKNQIQNAKKIIYKLDQRVMVVLFILMNKTN